MIKIEMNENEARVLLNLIDIAVKAAGIQAAEACLHFTKMITSQLNAEATPLSTPELE